MDVGNGSIAMRALRTLTSPFWEPFMCKQVFSFAFTWLTDKMMGIALAVVQMEDPA